MNVEPVASFRERIILCCDSTKSGFIGVMKVGYATG
jgi:hypothetical protein